MGRPPTRSVAPLLALVVLASCDGGAPTVPDRLADEPRLHSFARSAWRDPVPLGAPVSSACQDQTPTLSSDELALYFLSDRPGGMGSLVPATGCMDNFDLWVARRASRDAAWETATNLGPAINTTASEVSPELSDDGHLLFFASNRLRGAGTNDIYVARRDDPNDDLAWGSPTMLGAGVNAFVHQSGPSYRQSAEDGPANLYFYGGADNGAGADIYYAPVTRDGETRGGPVHVAEVNVQGVPDGFPTVRADGRELLFSSGRNGLFDLWVSTRESVHDAWSAPANLGPPVSSTAAEFQPNLSHDGRTLLFIAGGARGGLGRFDIWMATRAPAPDR